tara:strand:+ start:415 stop:663 length:249 start_codon:yes stop_codon:yes gene_type:complete
MKGGKTNTIDMKIIIVRKIQTIASDKGLDIASIDLSLLDRLHIILAITMEHIISKKKFLKLQNIMKLNPKIVTLYITELFNI